MKNFSKILVFLLSLAAIITAFTVVALAEDVGPVDRTPAGYGDFEDSALFDYATSSSTGRLSYDRDAWATVQLQDNGEKYVVVTAAPDGYKDTLSTDSGPYKNWTNSQWDISPKNTCNIVDYPYFLVELDITTLNGKYTGFQYNPRMYGSSTNGFIATIDFSALGLSTKAYDWNHVSLLYVYAGDAEFNIYCYVNGVLASSDTVNLSGKAPFSVDGATEEGLKKIKITSMKFYQEPGNDIRLDNMYFTSFPAEYLEGEEDVVTKIANYRYNYGEGYEFPYKYTVASITDAEGNVTYYDDLTNAVNAAGENDVVKLCANVTESITINKSVKIDTNVYTTDESTGETTVTGAYEFNWVSTEGYVADAVDGVQTITKSTQIVTVKWDAPCAEDCDCIGSHHLAKESIVVINETPKYVWEIPTLPEKDGLINTFAGWSYENDGTVDTLIPITEADVANGTLNLYPVYESVQYDLSLTASGKVTYYTIDKYVDVFEAAETAKNATVTLLRDAVVYDSITLDVNTHTTFDLRGNTLTRINLTGNTFYKNASGDYEAGEARTSTSAYVFYTKTRYVDLTVTSSTEGKLGNLVTYSVAGDIYYDESGNLEKYTATTVDFAHFIYFYNSADHDLTVTNLNIYSSRFLYAAGGSNHRFKFNVDNCNFYKTSSATSKNKDTYTFYFESNNGFTANIKNSLFYYPANMNGTAVFMRCHAKTPDDKHIINIDNCDIIGLTKQDIFNFYSSDISKYYLDSDSEVTVTKSRIYNTASNDRYTTYLGENTLYSATQVNTSTVLPGYVSVPSTASVPYTVPVSTLVTIDAETKQPVLSSSTTEIEVTFEYEIKKCSEVPESITDVSTAILYYTDFDLVLYIPVTEGMTIDSVAGFEATAGTVRIDGKEYYAYKKTCTTVNASDTVNAIVKYTVNEKTYQQTFEVSALIYAELTLNGSLSDVEAKAIANMVRYIKEARLASSLEAGEEFDELIALGNLSELGAKENYADATVNYSALSGYVKSVSFMVDGTFTAYVITMTDEAVAAGAEVTVSYVGGDAVTTTKDVITDADAGTETTRYLTTKTKVYDIASKAIEITVTVPAAEEGGESTVLTGTYSVNAYINATDNTLAKAMYEFGSAIKAYRDYILNI